MKVGLITKIDKELSEKLYDSIMKHLDVIEDMPFEKVQEYADINIKLENNPNPYVYSDSVYYNYVHNYDDKYEIINMVLRKTSNSISTYYYCIINDEFELDVSNEHIAELQQRLIISTRAEEFHIQKLENDKYNDDFNKFTNKLKSILR